MFDRKKFHGRVIAEGYTLVTVSEKLGISPVTMTRKMSRGGDFTRSELQRLRSVLNLSDEDMNEIFFAEELA